MSKTEENKKLLQTSLDYTICKKEIINCGIVGIIATVVLVSISLIAQSWRFMLVLIPIVLVCFPISFMKFNRMVEITKNCETVVLCETMLTDPQPAINATNYFSVVIKDSTGKEFKAETSAIATSRGLTKPHYTELNNKKALIAYNETTEQVIVVKIL